MPALATEDPIEAHLRSVVGRAALGGRHAPGPQLPQRDGVLLLLVADLLEQAVGVLVAGRVLVDLGRDRLLHRLLAREQPIDGRHPRLQPPPGGDLHAPLVRDRDAELAHPRLEPRAMRALDFSQLAKHLRAARIGLAARDQPIDDGGLDLVGPGLEQPRADI